MNLFRFGVSFFLFFSFFFLPGIWWLVILLAVSLALPFYFEGILFALWYDLLYGPFTSTVATTSHLANKTMMDFSLFLLIGLVLLTSLLFRDWFRVARASDRYLS